MGGSQSKREQIKANQPMGLEQPGDTERECKHVLQILLSDSVPASFASVMENISPGGHSLSRGALNTLQVPTPACFLCRLNK